MGDHHFKILLKKSKATTHIAGCALNIIKKNRSSKKQISKKRSVDLTKECTNQQWRIFGQKPFTKIEDGDTLETLSIYYNKKSLNKICEYIKKNRDAFSDFFRMYKIYSESGFFILKKTEIDLPCDILVTEIGEIFIQLKERIGSGEYKRSDLAIEFNSGKIVVISLERVEEEEGLKEFYQAKKIVNTMLDSDGSPPSGIIKIYGLYYLHDRKEIKKADGKVKKYDKIITIAKFCNGGNLKNRITAQALSASEKEMIFRQVCEGVKSLKKEGFSHNDLHDGNILLNADSNGKIKTVVISDFGKSTNIGDPVPNIINLRLTTPDFLKTKKFIADKFDEFSLGLLLYLLYVGKESPWSDSVFEAIKEALKDKWDKWDEMGKNPKKYLGLDDLKDIPKSIRVIIKKLLEPNLDKRITAEEINCPG